MPQSEIEIVKIGFYLDVKNVSLSLEAAKKVSPPDFSVTLEAVSYTHLTLPTTPYV